MRKITFCILFASIAIFNITADFQWRTAGIMAWENGNEDNDGDNRFWGIETEGIHSKKGSGFDAMVDFYDNEQDQDMLDWRGELFTRYHLFGSRGFLDPYIGIGIGNAGTVRLEDGEELKLSLYPFLSAGGNVMFEEGFFAGGRWSWRIEEWSIPGTDIPEAGIGGTQVTLFAGWSYNCDWHWDDYHGRGGRKNHFHFE